MNFCFDAHPRVAATGGTPPAGTERLFNAVTGGISLSTTVLGAHPNSTSSRTFQAAPSSSFAYMERTFTAQNSVCLRLYMFFNGALPTTDCNLIRVGASSGASCFLRYRTATTDLVTAFVATGTPVSSAYTVVADRLYRIDMVVDATTARTVSCQVNGVEIGPLNSVGAVTFTTLRIGCGTLTSDLVTGTVNYNHIGYGFSTTDYPFGDGYVASVYAGKDWTHSVSSAGNFKINNTTNIDGTETNLWTNINPDDLTASTARITANAVATNDYVSFGANFSGTAIGPNIRCITPLVVLRNESGTTANGITVRIMRDGATFDDLVPNVSLASASNLYLCRGYSNGGNWRLDNLDTTEARFGFASSVGSIPGLWAIRWMVEYALPAAQGRMPLIALL